MVKKSKKYQTNMYLLAIVAIVAIVGIVVLVLNANAGGESVAVVDEDGNLVGQALRSYSDSGSDLIVFRGEEEYDIMKAAFGDTSGKMSGDQATEGAEPCCQNPCGGYCYPSGNDCSNCDCSKSGC